MNTELTPRQEAVYTFLGEYIREHHGMPPTRAEIAAHFGWRSPNSAEEHLQALSMKGLITLRAATRGIRLVNVIDPFDRVRKKIVELRSTVEGAYNSESEYRLGAEMILRTIETIL